MDKIVYSPKDEDLPKPPLVEEDINLPPNPTRMEDESKLLVEDTIDVNFDTKELPRMIPRAQNRATDVMATIGSMLIIPPVDNDMPFFVEYLRMQKYDILDSCLARTEGELLQRTTRHMMHELVRSIFTCLADLDSTGTHANDMKRSSLMSNSYINNIGNEYLGDDNDGSSIDNGSTDVDAGKSFPRTGSNHLAIAEDVPLFALGLINAAIELGGASIGRHP
ncbi:hypothetical protein KI387_029578, partial [Taxus chinensis]